MVEEAGVAWTTRFAAAALAARLAAPVVRHVRAAAARIERVVRARVPIVAVMRRRRQDEATEGERTVVTAVVEVVRVTVIALFARIDYAVTTEARDAVRQTRGDARVGRKRQAHRVEAVRSRGARRADHDAPTLGSHRKPELVTRSGRGVEEDHEGARGRGVEEEGSAGVDRPGVVERRRDEHEAPDSGHRRAERIARGGRRLQERLQQCPARSVEEIGGARLGRPAAVERCADEHIAVYERHCAGEEVARGRGRLAEHPQQCASADLEEVRRSCAHHATAAVERSADQDLVPGDGERRPEEVPGLRAWLLDDA